MTYSFVKSERVLIEGHFTPATIVIENGKISSIEDLNFPVTSAHSKTKIHDFGKKTLIPGLVDTHVHINEPGRAHWEGFATASQAARHTIPPSATEGRRQRIAAPIAPPPATLPQAACRPSSPAAAPATATRWAWSAALP